MIPTLIIRPYAGFSTRVWPLLHSLQLQTIDDQNFTSDLSLNEILGKLMKIFSASVLVIPFNPKKDNLGSWVNGLTIFEAIMDHPILSNRFGSKRIIITVSQFGEVLFRTHFYEKKSAYKVHPFIMYEGHMNQGEMSHRIATYLETGKIIIPSPA